MSIVKTLPAVLIAAVGISFGFVGTALADTIIKADKILVPENDELVFKPSHMGGSTICFQTTDKLEGYIMIMPGMDEPDLLEATPTEKCISKSTGRMPIIIVGAFRDLPDESKSIRVYVKESQSRY